MKAAQLGIGWAFAGLAVQAAGCAAPIEGGAAPSVEDGTARTEATTLSTGTTATLSTATIGSSTIRYVDPCASGRYPTTYVLRLYDKDSYGTAADGTAYGAADGYTIYFPTRWAYLKDQVQYEALISQVPAHFSYEYLIKNVLVERNANGSYTMKGYADKDQHQFFLVGWWNWNDYSSLVSDVDSTPTPNGYASWSVEPNVEARVATCVVLLDGPDYPGAILEPTGESYPFADEHDPTRNPN